jgi:ubiquinone biosynthesis protein COQ4
LLAFMVNRAPEGIDSPLEYKFDLISQGIRIARQAKPLFPVKFEEGLERPIDEWRAELNIVPVTEGPWSWYSRPYLRDAIAPTLAAQRS